jgi:hypothetical protein
MTEAEPSPRSRRSRWLIALLGLVGLLAFGGVWIVATGLLARHDADAVRTEIRTLKVDLADGNESEAVHLEHKMQSQASSARARTAGPAWWAWSEIPYFGRPARTVRGGVAVVDDLANRALPYAVQAGGILDPHLLRPDPRQIDTARLTAAVKPLQQAVAASSAVDSRAKALPASTWLGMVNASRNSLVDQLQRLTNTLSDLSVAARDLPSALGQDGTKRYFVAFETDAEARGLGGLPGAYAILRASHGSLQLTRFGADSDLSKVRATVDFGAAYNSEYGATFGPKTYFGNSDASPHFPYAAQLWMSMWENKFHQKLDGAIATDPTALSYLVGAIGSVKLADGTALTASNTVPFFENGVYSRFARNDLARKEYQVHAAETVSSAIIHDSGTTLLAVASALQKAANQRRLLIYTADPTIEASVQRQAIGGVLPETTRPFLDVVTNDGGADKLDYYLDRTVTYRRSSCAAGPAEVIVQLHNDAPSTGLPPTVSGSAAVRHPDQMGRTEVLLSLYGTEHSSVNSVTVNGHHGFYDAEHERGHPVSIVDVTIGPGATTTVVYHVHEPLATGPVLALEQPLVRPLHQAIDSPTC